MKQEEMDALNARNERWMTKAIIHDLRNPDATQMSDQAAKRWATADPERLKFQDSLPDEELPDLENVSSHTVSQFDRTRLKRQLSMNEGVVKDRAGRHVMYDDKTGKRIYSVQELSPPIYNADGSIKEQGGKATIGHGQYVAGNPIPDEFWAQFGGKRDLYQTGMSVVEADWLLDYNIDNTVAYLKTTPYWDKLNGARRRVMIDMIFNMGIDSVNGFTSMMAGLNSDDFEKAANNMLYNYAYDGTETGRTKYYKDTKGRAERMARIMRTGEAISYYD